MEGTWCICTNILSTHTVCLNALYRIRTENVETHVHCLWGITASTGANSYSWISFLSLSPAQC